MAQAKLPSAPMADFFQKLIDEFGESSEFMSHLASHPDLAGRVAAAKDADIIGDSPFDAVLTASEWNDLRAMCSVAGSKQKSKGG